MSPYFLTRSIHLFSACAALNGSCEECLKNVSCMYCTKTSSCLVYPYKDILPSSELCSLSSLRWGVCWGLFFKTFFVLL